MSAHEGVRQAALALGEALAAGMDATMEQIAYDVARAELAAEQAKHEAVVSSCRDLGRDQSAARR